jgi:polyisoprenoid-binding protein YceI
MNIFKMQFVFDSNINFKKSEMKKSFKIFAALLLMSIIGVQTHAQEYKVSPDESVVKWNGKKVTGEHYGTIKFKSGSLEVANGQISGGNFQIDMTTIKCDDLTNPGTNAKLVGHLKSDDFFSVDTYPTASMTITGVKKLSGNEFEYTGDLTIKGITNPVTFKASTTTNGGTIKAEGKMVIDRSKYNVRFGSGAFFQNLGDNLIYDEFTLDFSLSAKK